MRLKELRILSAIAAVLLAAQSVSFSATDGWLEEKIVLALQGSPKVELYIISYKNSPNRLLIKDFKAAKMANVPVYLG
jgi:hypothetical protein